MRSAASRRMRFSLALARPSCPSCGQPQRIEPMANATTPHVCPVPQVTTA